MIGKDYLLMHLLEQKQDKGQEQHQSEVWEILSLLILCKTDLKQIEDIHMAFDPSEKRNRSQSLLCFCSLALVILLTPSEHHQQGTQEHLEQASNPGDN